MAATLILMRHGLIEANRQGHWHGSTDSPLLPHGKAQARRTGRYLARQAQFPVAIYSSPLQRCQSTAELVSQGLNNKLRRQQRRASWSRSLHRLSFGIAGQAQLPPPRAPFEPVVIDDLREYAIGDWEGMAFAELARSHQFVDNARNDLDYAPPGGESLRGVSERVSRALLDLHARHGDGEHVLVVAHGAGLAVGLATLLNNDPRKWTDYHFDNCSLTELQLADLPELRRFNLTGHL